MSSLDAITGTGTYAKTIGGVAAAPSAFVEATIATTPTVLDEEVMVLVGAEGSQLQAGPCRWEPRPVAGGLLFPTRGDPCVVATGDQGHRLIVWWKPAVTPALTVTALPLEPSDGQEVYLQTTAMATAGVPPYRLRYRATNPNGTANAATFKWEAMGPKGWMSGASAATATLTGTPTAAADGQPSITVPLAGEWDFINEFKNNGSPAGASIVAGIFINGTQLALGNVLFGAYYTAAWATGASDFSGAFTRRGRMKVAAGDVVTVRYSGATGASVAERFLELTPHRVG